MLRWVELNQGKQNNIELKMKCYACSTIKQEVKYPHLVVPEKLISKAKRHSFSSSDSQYSIQSIQCIVNSTFCIFPSTLYFCAPSQQTRLLNVKMQNYSYTIFEHTLEIYLVPSTPKRARNGQQ